MATVSERAVDRDVVRAFLMELVPREAAGVRIDDGRRATVVSRAAPLPWADFDRAVRRGRELRVSPIPVTHDGATTTVTVLWMHLPDPTLMLDRAAAQLQPVGPGMLVRTPRGADVYWRIHPVGADVAVAAMAQVAQTLQGIAGDPMEYCRVPVSREELWMATPATVWAMPALIAAASSYAARETLAAAIPAVATGDDAPAPSRLDGQPEAANDGQLGLQAPAPQPPSDEGADAIPWPEADVLLETAAASENVDAAGLLWMAAMRDLIRRLGQEVVCRTLGVDAIGLRSGVACVLREGRWWRVRGDPNVWRLRLLPLHVSEAAGDGRSSARKGVS